MGKVTGFRITARALERRLVDDKVLVELKCLEDCSSVSAEALAPPEAEGKVVFVLEEAEGPRPTARPA